MDFRKLYEYHFALNRKIWDDYVAALTETQFTQDLDYSVGSIRNHTVHMMVVDKRWFCGLRGEDVPDFPDPEAFPDRAAVRTMWDQVEADMRGYLNGLSPEMLDRPFPAGLTVWEVLFHVLNHGTDHRAQVLAMLHRLGVATGPQDYALYVMGRL